MEVFLVVALIVVLGVLAYLLLEQRRSIATQSTPVQIPPTQPVVDVDALVAGIRATVEAEMRKTAQETIQLSSQQSADFFKAQTAALDEKTKALLQPFQSQVEQLAQSVNALGTTYSQEQATVQALAQQITSLQSTATSLTNALKSPTARGSWGENQLRNVIQLAGMESFCDYTEQFAGGEGERNQRPDVVVRLPNGASLAVDSKAPLSAYQRMQDASDVATKELELKAHAKSLRDHVKTLADKRYWDQFPQAPDFVVMFIPGEGFVSDAMRADPTLLDDAMRQRVLVASPVNLLALLLAVAKGWQAHKVAEHAEQVARLGAEVYDRVGTVLESVVKMGNGLSSSTKAYNDMVGSLESRLLVTLRKFRDLGVVQSEIKDIKQIESAPRGLSVPEAPRELS